MAVVARQPVVTAIERKARVQVVIEGRERPVAAVVALGTVVAKRLSVRVIVGMASDAIRRHVVKAIARMACAARNGGVQAR